MIKRGASRSGKGVEHRRGWADVGGVVIVSDAIVISIVIALLSRGWGDLGKIIIVSTPMFLFLISISAGVGLRSR